MSYRRVIRYADNATALTAHAEAQSFKGYPSGTITRDRPVPTGTDLARLWDDADELGATFAAGTEYVLTITDSTGATAATNADGIPMPATQDAAFAGYDIIYSCLQSNTKSGATLSAGVDDVTDADVHQWGQGCGLLLAIEPLDHVSVSANRIGHVMTFARDHYVAGALAANRKVLIVPCGEGTTGFASGEWIVGGSLFVKMAWRVRAALALFPGSRVVAGMWQGGERDGALASPPATFIASAAAAVAAMRAEVGAHPVFFGQMTPEEIASDADALAISGAIDDLPDTVPDCHVISSTGLAGIVGEEIHFDRPSQVTLAARYWTAFEALL